MEKGSDEAKEQAQKMREGKEAKKKFEESILNRIDNLASAIVVNMDGINKRLEKLENPQEYLPPKEEIISEPRIVNPTEIEGYDLMPYKAREILKEDFSEAKLIKVKPYKGGFLVILDVTHLTEQKYIPIMKIDEMGQQRQEMKPLQDHRAIPVKSMRLEKDMEDGIKLIKINMGWIKKERTPEFTEREVTPAFGTKKPLPDGVRGTSEAEFFSRE